MSFWQIIFIIVLIMILLVLISSVIDNNIFKKRFYTIDAKYIAKNCRVIFLSDLHGNRFGQNNQKLIEAIINAAPDIVLVGGDMITAKAEKVGDKDWKNTFDLFEGIKQIPIYYGMGNHEYRMDLYRDSFKDAFDRYNSYFTDNNIPVLYNKSYYIEEYNVEIKGLEIDRKYYKRFEKHHMTPEYIEQCVGTKQANAFNILLAHNPEYFDSYSTVGDLTLSGHVHGGIAKLPFLGGVISPRLTLFPKYDGGLFTKGETNMVISRGLGSHTLPFRLFNPCELVIIDLKKI